MKLGWRSSIIMIIIIMTIIIEEGDRIRYYTLTVMTAMNDEYANMMIAFILFGE